jgi:hypothetical protein
MIAVCVSGAAVCLGAAVVSRLGWVAPLPRSPKELSVNALTTIKKRRGGRCGDLPWASNASRSPGFVSPPLGQTGAGLVAQEE